VVCLDVPTVIIDGDCEIAASEDSSEVLQRGPIIETNGKDVTKDNDLSLKPIGECKGSADCFRGTVTEIIDGDTIDVNNVRIRLSMVNTPEKR
jgi:endonuclease YncB( thermonuclease family)